MAVSIPIICWLGCQHIKVIFFLWWFSNERSANYQSDFRSNCLFFVIERSIWSWKRIELLLSIFCKDRQYWFAHGRSFLKIDRIDSITVNLFQRSTRSIRSRSIDESKSIPSIFKKDWRVKIGRNDLIFWHTKGENCQKHTKNTFFQANRSLFENYLIFLIFYKDRRERFDLFDLFQISTRGIWSFQSFSKIDESDLITGNLFKRLKRAIWSQSIFFKNPKDWKIKDQKIERYNDWKI